MFDKPVRSVADYEMEWIGHDNFNPQDYLSRSLNDPATAGTARVLDFKSPFTFAIGRIVLSVAGVHQYKVQLADLSTHIWCTALAQTSLQPTGARQLNTLSEGTQVLIISRPDDKSRGLILATIPDFITSSNKGRSDEIAQSSRCGVATEKLYNDLFKFKRNGGIINYMAGRPRDSLPVGEWGAITESGLAFFLDSWMAYIRADEFNGLYIFHDTNPLIRLTGENIQLRTIGYELERLFDQGEVVGFSGSTPYFWEWLGALTYGTSANRSFSATQSQISEPYYASVEPLYDDQQPFFRTQTFDGYLGQGGKRQVVVPTQAELTTVNRYSSTPNRPCVFDESIGLSGRYSLTSAKGIHISKRPIIAAPKLVKRPETASGDNDTNYKAAGLLGSGQAHIVQAEIPLSGDDANMVNIAAIMDIHAHIHRKQNIHPFVYHIHDWHVPAEGSQTPLTTNMQPPPYSNLNTQQYLAPPVVKRLKIDHRIATADYYLNEAAISLLDDGSVSISDGYGSEIRLAGGNIEFNCPGDFVVHAARNIVKWAGKDINIRAKNNVDICTTLQDIKIKAQQHAMIVGGISSDNGGVLIESKAPCKRYDFSQVGTDTVSSGIVLKAVNSPIIMDGGQLVLNARGLSTDNPVTPLIYLTAINGRIKSAAKYHERFIESAAFDFFTPHYSNNPDSVNEYWADTSYFGSKTRIKGKLEVDGCLMLNGWMSIINGHIATDNADKYGCKVLPLTASTISTQDLYLQNLRSRATDLQTINAHEVSDTNLYDPQLTENWRKAEFSFRNTIQYGTTNFRIYEARWQQTARLGGLSLPTWVETAIPTASDNTYPYPGKEAFISTGSYKTVDLKLFDCVTGLCQPDNASLYNNPTFSIPASTTLNQGYIVLN